MSHGLPPAVVAVLAIGTLTAAVALLVLLDWLTARWHRPAASPAPRAVSRPAPARPGRDTDAYEPAGVFATGEHPEAGENP